MEKPITDDQHIRTLERSFHAMMDERDKWQKQCAEQEILLNKYGSQLTEARELLRQVVDWQRDPDRYNGDLAEIGIAAQSFLERNT